MFGAGVSVEDELRKALPGHFVITGPLGAGGQGSVFKGTCNGHEAAIKAFTPTTDPRRVDREMELLRAIDCDNLVRVIDATKLTILAVEVSVIAYEFHSNGDLMGHLQPTAPSLTAAELGRIGREIGGAIEALWGQRIVHRDVKPANIVRAGDGRFVLVDVGLARHIDRSAISVVGSAPGTPGFMSPEQAMGRKALTIHADAFSLGVTLYTLAAKRHPFNGNQGVIMQRLVPTSLHSLRPDLPEALCRAIDKLMSLRPSGRPTNLVDLFANY
jgi:serine/threonine-protein kinase